MKILIIGFAKIKYMPYLKLYLDTISCESDIHVIYWNRDGSKEDLSRYSHVTFHEFSCCQKDDVPRITKIKNFVGFRKFARKLLGLGEFDLVVCLHTFSGLLVSDILKKQYQGRYIFDYRDSTYESFAPFRRAIGNLVKNSFATFVSSEMFRALLPESEKNKIFISHNLQTDSLEHRDKKRTHSDRLRIAFWGLIRDEKVNREIIRKIAADERLELHYYGREQQTALNLKKYARSIRASNVYFHGEYSPEQRYDFAGQTDIIHNVFSDKNMMIAMSNRYYDGAIFRIPQICMAGSYMGQRVVKSGIGLACDPYEKDFTDKIYDYFFDLDIARFKASCDEELSLALHEYNRTKDIIRSFAKGVDTVRK